MRLKTVAMLFALPALAAQLDAAAPASPKEAVARAVTREVRDDFTKHTKAEIRAAITPVDINADGIQDWQVHRSACSTVRCAA